MAKDMMNSFRKGGFYTDLESWSGIHKRIAEEVAERQERYIL
jgi:hypothetical protein